MRSDGSAVGRRGEACNGWTIRPVTESREVMSLREVTIE